MLEVSYKEILNLLNFLAKPQILNFPDRIQAQIEHPITIQCNTRGAPTPQITWTKDRKPIDLNSDRFALLPDNDLMIKSVGIEDQGYYSCEARNEFGVDVKNTLLEIVGLGRMF